jgi:hypothetical protein
MSDVEKTDISKNDNPDTVNRIIACDIYGEKALVLACLFPVFHIMLPFVPSHHSLKLIVDPKISLCR